MFETINNRGEKKMATRTNKDGDFFLTSPTHPSRKAVQTPEQERQERREEISTA
jgi:hypothetical protein